MSFNSSDSSKINNENSILYNYYSTQIYLNQFQRTIPNDGYIQIPFVSNKPEPNITSDLFPLQYKTSYLYIVKSHDLLRDVSYNAELVIEHISSTNNNSTRLFSCIPLKTVSTESTTTIDKIITPSSDLTSLNIVLDDVINVESKKIFYTDRNNNRIILFTTPISINTVFDDSLNGPITPLFDISAGDYTILLPVSQKNDGSKKDMKEGFVEGLTKTAYCQPIDVIDPDMNNEANLSIPLVGKYTNNDATNNMIRTAINFMAFVLVLGFTYVVTPIIYNEYIVGLIQFQGQQKMNRLRAIDMYTCFVFIMVSFGLISQGVQKNNANSTLMGFFVGLFFIVSMVVIQSTKMNGDWLIKNFKVDGNETMINSLYTKVSPDLWNFIMENVSLFISNKFLGALIFFVFAAILYLFGSFNKNGIMNSLSGVTYLILFTIYITIVVATLRKNQ
jgi:hypothetical protein